MQHKVWKDNNMKNKDFVIICWFKSINALKAIF